MDAVYYSQDTIGGAALYNKDLEQPDLTGKSLLPRFERDGAALPGIPGIAKVLHLRLMAIRFCASHLQ